MIQFFIPSSLELNSDDFPYLDSSINLIHIWNCYAPLFGGTLYCYDSFLGTSLMFFAESPTKTRIGSNKWSGFDEIGYIYNYDSD